MKAPGFPLFLRPYYARLNFQSASSAVQHGRFDFGSRSFVDLAGGGRAEPGRRLIMGDFLNTSLVNAPG